MTSIVFFRVKDKYLERLKTSLVLIRVKDKTTRASGDVDSVL